MREWKVESGLSPINVAPTKRDDTQSRPGDDGIADMEDEDGEKPPSADDEVAKAYAEMTEEQKIALTNQAFDDILFECFHEVAFETYREVKKEQSLCQVCHTKCLQFAIGDKNAVQEKFQCYKCNSLYPAQRYAPHLEKCLGFGGRVNSRSSSRRPGADRSSASPIADSETDSIGSAADKNKKRKESPLRKTLTKKMRTALPDSPPTLLLPKREAVPSSPLRTSFMPDLPIQPALGNGVMLDFLDVGGEAPDAFTMAETFSLANLPDADVDADGEVDAPGSEDDWQES
ncbi:hypothetical protein HKX48_002484 [Thoreauomyces humboldtii]|nr:hypothetical protein HKX48_002484 [Thoreauomyces humboldtii]